MTRRWALAAAFFLTALFGFMVVAYGSSTGMFAWSDGGAQNNAAQPAPPLATAVPVLVTDFVYVDPTPGAQQPSDSGPLPEASGQRERDHEEDEHADDGVEHEDDD